jgi:hypothetical protein
MIRLLENETRHAMKRTLLWASEGGQPKDGYEEGLTGIALKCPETS